MQQRVVVVGGGIGGLVAAIDLARAGLAVTVLERAAAPGGKLRAVGPGSIDAGPTVFTMRAVFEEIFADAGTTLDAHLTLHPATTLARHAWAGDRHLDLFADIDRSADAIAAFAGPAEAQGYRDFCARTRAIFRTLQGPFIRGAQPTPLSLVTGAGLRGLADLWRIVPFAPMWQALGEHFRDPRLRQLFGRYATYSGSSPFLAPATLMLIAHVEQDGVWLVEGGMVRLAEALAGLAATIGVTLRCDAHVARIGLANGRASGVELAGGEVLEADHVVVNADAGALATGLLGSPTSRAAPPQPPAGRSLSAVTWAMQARTEGFALDRHNVFFSGDYAREFDELFRRRVLPTEPTIYVCAQDRGLTDPPAGPERLLVLVNAPPTGDTDEFTATEIERCADRSFHHLARLGLRIERTAECVTTNPADFHRMFPATGGALYGQAVHGPMAAFRRAANRSRIPGIYLAGGSAHPGAGVPMAALSGRQAARCLLADLASTARSRRTATPGGTSTR